MRKILICIILLIPFIHSRSQDSTLTRDELRVMAAESFTRTDFASASVYYHRLLDYYPMDPVYHFYLGACKEELDEDLKGAAILLEFASIRYAPPEVHYYLGLVYQKQGDFDKALGSFTKYSNSVSRREMLRRQVDKRILECKGKQKMPAKETITIINNPKPEKHDSLTILTEIKEKPVVMPLKTTAEESGYMALLNYALRIQMKSDSLVREAERMRREVPVSADWNTKKKIMAEINVRQTEADNLQSHANTIYSKAREMELQFVKSSVNLSNSGLTDSSSVIHSGQSSIGYAEPSKKLRKEDHSGPSLNKPLSDFSILETSPYSEKNPITFDTVPYAGVIYKIQVGVFSKPVTFRQFRGLSPLSAERIAENGFTRYYTGIFVSIRETEIALEKVRNYGFREAFIVSFYNGKKISLIRAREIEQMLK